MAVRVNLDAMIKREDLDLTDKDPAQITIGSQLKLYELEQTSASFHILRKPDFQRETSNWDPEKIAGIIISFLDGDLIPSIIVWRSSKSGKLFVIDGAHRLSALIAWINSDYGDGPISRAFFSNVIDDNQLKAAKKTRDLVDAKVGSYQDLKGYVIKPEGSPDPETLLRARNGSALSLTLQDVKGDVARAEKSFLKINQSATPIDPTELIIIEARRKANAIAARALLRAGTGHPYWGAFSDDRKEKITKLSSEIYEHLFQPILQYPIRTLSLPAAGHSVTPDSLDLIFNLVNHVNDAFDSSKKKNEARWKVTIAGADIDLEDDEDGEMTIGFLTKVLDTSSRVFGPATGSLALHPGVYCYGATGRFQPTAFFAAIDLVKYLEIHRKFDAFTESRSKFEEFLMRYRFFINQIVGSYGSQLKGLPALNKMYQIILSEIIKGRDDASVVNKIASDGELSFIRDITDDDRKYGRNFSKETRSAIYLREALAKELTCGICNSRLHSKSITIDHKQRKQDGGVGSPDNGQLAHPYCNNGFKEKMVHASATSGT